MALSDGLICYFAFDSNAVDSIGGNELALTGNAAVSSGQSQFGGASLYVPAASRARDTSPDVALAMEGEATIGVSLWFYADSLSGARYLVQLDGSWSLYVVTSFGNAQVQVLLRDDSGSSTSFVSYVEVVAASQWNHVAISRNGRDVTAYINGVKQTVEFPAGYTVFPNQESYALDVGTNSKGSSVLEGYIDDFAVWNRELTDAEASLLYTSGAPVVGSGGSAARGRRYSFNPVVKSPILGHE